jgi:nucleoid-associated protein YgaU
MNRIIVIAAMAVLALGLLGSGCSQSVTREANVSAGDYYTDAEFSQLGTDQRDAYCKDLSQELSRLRSRTAEVESGLDEDQALQLRRDKARLQSQIRAQQREVEDIVAEIEYYESLPTSYTVVRGDCLWRISEQEQIYANPYMWTRLYRANRDQISDPDLIYVNQVLDIPRDWSDDRMHRVVRGEWLGKIAGYREIYGDIGQWTRIYEANRDQINDPDLIYPDQILDIPR